MELFGGWLGVCKTANSRPSRIIQILSPQRSLEAQAPDVWRMFEGLGFRVYGKPT